MPPTILFFKTDKRKIHLILSAALTAENDYNAFADRTKYHVVAEYDDAREVPIRSVKVSDDLMEVYLELGATLEEDVSYRFSSDASGDTVSDLRASSAGYPDPRENIAEEFLEEADKIEQAFNTLNETVGNSTTSLQQALDDATTRITGTPPPQTSQVTAAAMSSPQNPAFRPGTLSGVREDLLTASSHVASSISGFADRVVDQFGHGMADSLLGFPFLTEQVTPRTTPSSSTSTTYGGGSPSLQNTVDSAIRAVLGRPVSAGDPKSFQASLNAAFTISQFEGHTVWTYTPRSFAGAAEFGESMTGMVASLVAMANNALNQTLPMIDSLTSLDPTVEPDALEAKRAIVRTEWNEFVLELQTPGGPRAARADMILAGLTNPGGYLYEFGVDLGMVDSSNQITRQRVITLDDEDNLTRYISLRDYISSIANSWLNYRNNFYLTDLGTSLLNLSRSLSVVADELTDLTDALDSVYVGSAERLTIRVRVNVDVDNPPAIPSGTGAGEPVPPAGLSTPISVGGPVNADISETSLLLQDVIDWIDRFVRIEASQLISTGGRRGTAVIQNTSNVLRSIVRNIIEDVTHTPHTKASGTYLSKIPVGLRHPRVRIPLRDLADGLYNVLVAASFAVQDTATTSPVIPGPPNPYPFGPKTATAAARVRVP